MSAGSVGERQTEDLKVTVEHGVDICFFDIMVIIPVCGTGDPFNSAKHLYTLIAQSVRRILMREVTGSSTVGVPCPYWCSASCLHRVLSWIPG